MKAKNRRKLADRASELDWYAFRTVPQKEFVAQEILRRRGLATFVPPEVVYRHKNKFAKARGEPKEERRYPLMRGWMFIGFNPSAPVFYDVMNLSVISRVVVINGKPVKMNGKELHSFMEKYAHGIVHPKEERYMRTHGEFEVGDQVRVIDGPFEGRTFKADQIEDGTAYFTHELLGKLITVPVETRNLEAA